nr:hypothetical protein GCM10025730_05750 [Promicromonospora thailandica]
MRGTIGLIGRSQESARLAAVLAEQATTRSLVVTGEAGVGKTELLTHLATDAAGRGWQVLRSTCAEAEQQYPYSSLDQVLRHLEGHVGSLSDHQRHAIDVALGREAADGPAAVPTLGAAVLDLLNAAAVRSHCLVVVDDVHWADDAGAAVLVFVARRLGPGSRVAMVLGARTGEPTRIDTGGIDHLDLTPLDPPSAEQLLSALHPDLSPDQKSDVLDRAAGNPLAITELPAWPSTVGTTVGTTLHPAADPALPCPAASSRCTRASSRDCPPTSRRSSCSLRSTARRDPTGTPATGPRRSRRRGAAASSTSGRPPVGPGSATRWCAPP